MAYSTADSDVLSAVATTDGGGWSVWYAIGETLSTAETTSFNSSSPNCSATWVTTPSGTITLPSTSSSATGGTSAVWAFILAKGASEATGTILFATVLSGSTTVWFYGSQIACNGFDFGLASDEPLPSGVIDSTTAVSDANAVGGSTFLTHFGNAVKDFVVYSSVSTGIPSTVWGVQYEARGCGAGSATSFEASVNALTGAAVYASSATVTCPPTAYFANFTETGLPAGTDWSVTINGSTNAGQGSTISIYPYLPNGSYPFTIANVDGATPSPASGTLHVDGSSTNTSVTFAGGPALYRVSVTESGLPTGTNWSGELYNGTLSAQFYGTTPTLSVEVGNGAYTVDIYASDGYTSNVTSAPVTVAGAAVTLHVGFRAEATYPLTFTETGLPSSTWWAVSVTPSTPEILSSSTNSISMNVPNGSYTYFVGAIAGENATPYNGSFTVDGSGFSQSISFRSAHLYSVTFTETGLPSGTVWDLFLEDRTLDTGATTTSTSLVLSAPNGTYLYYPGQPKGYSPTPFYGFLNVTGKNNSTTITYSVFVQTYPVAFVETGLPSGTNWSLDLGNASSHTTHYSDGTSDISINLQNGSYSYSIEPVTNFTASPSSGPLTVAGTFLLETIQFTAVASGSYSVMFDESGLPFGTEWWVDVTGGSSWSSYGSTASWSEPNGTYDYTLVSANKSYAGVGASFTVNDAAVTQDVTFALVTYAVTFTETGLPTGTTWWVNQTIGGNETGSTASLSWVEPNGTYHYTLASTEKAYAASGASYTVSGHAVQVTVTFQLGTFTVTFTETGLPVGTQWWVNQTGGGTWNGTAPTLSWLEPNGTYSYTVATANRTYAAPTGSYTVDDHSVSVSVTFHQVTFTVTFTESGLPSGTEWWVNQTVGGTWSGSTTTLSWSEPNGSFHYTIATTDKSYAATGGVYGVTGSAATVHVTFSAVTYALTFAETGLSAGTSWSITIAGSPSPSTTATIVLQEVNGTYPYSVTVSSASWQVVGQSGNATVHGSAVTVDVTFEYAYPVTITESGLPSGSGWSAEVQAAPSGGLLADTPMPASAGSYVFSSVTSTLSFSLPNGSYTYKIVSAVSGWNPSSGSGSLTVHGGATPASITETFAQPTSSTTIFGLAETTFYAIVAAVIIVVVALALVALRLRKPKPPMAQPTPSEGGAGSPPAATGTGTAPASDLGGPGSPPS